MPNLLTIGITITPKYSSDATQFAQKRYIIKLYDQLISYMHITGYNQTYNELHFEYFNNGNLHAHGYIQIKYACAQKYYEKMSKAVAKDIAKYICLLQKQRLPQKQFSKYAYSAPCCYVSIVEDLPKWIEYINKENVFPVYKFLTIVERIEWEEV